MPKVSLAINRFPANMPRIAVLGSRFHAPRAAQEMAYLVGRKIVESGAVLVTGGRIGIDKLASHGALDACKENRVDVMERVFPVVHAFGKPAFDIGTVVHAGNDLREKRIAIIQNTDGAIVICGGQGTNASIEIALLKTVMGRYNLIPLKGTEGVADTICSRIPPFNIPALNDPAPSEEKAEAAVREVLSSEKRWYHFQSPDMARRSAWFSSDFIYSLKVTYF